MKRQRRTFTTEFKLQMVQLAGSGKPRADIVKEYDLTASALDNWIKKYQQCVTSYNSLVVPYTII